ncbi:MAG: hypothetical protein IT430_03625 [Phycisphaerales bacterium]|nr:hypothetical protein [Phycisphaerales bacterium]
MSRQMLLAVVVVGLLAVAGQASGQVLSQSGPCPGTKTFSVTGGAPFTRFAFIHAANTGSWTIPGGLVCFGTTTGLAAPVTLAGYVAANGSGNAAVTQFIPAPVCGNRYLQVVDTMTCTVSNVILIN